MGNLYSSLLAAMALLWTSSLPAQNAADTATETSAPSLFEFFHQQEDSLPLLRLDTEWGLLVRNKMKEEYQAATLSFRQDDGSMAKLDVKIRARGNVRKEVCFYPPIKIKAKKKQLSALGFNSQNELKLVFPCKNGSRYEECMLREALSYRFYEAIHPIHVQTKIVRLEGWQEDTQRHTFYALLVEDEENLAARLDAKVVRQGVLRSSALERDSYLKMCFFQYMIANVDWSVANKHNLEVLAVPGFDRMIIVPYDFDYAGFIGSHYAVPAPSLPIKDVNQRYFLGYDVTEEEALSTARFFLSRKEEILSMCASFELMEEKERVSMQRYLSKFFDLLEDEKKVIRTFANAD